MPVTARHANSRLDFGRGSEELTSHLAGFIALASVDGLGRLTIALPMLVVL
jgi:hypothetical protein